MLKNIFYKIKNWFENLFKQKCPKCKSLNISVAEKELIDKYIETKYYDNTDPRIKAMNTHHYRRDYENIECYKVEISVFKVKYKCDICEYIWCKKIKDKVY